MHPSSATFPRKPPRTASCRARPSHAKVPLPDAVLSRVQQQEQQRRTDSFFTARPSTVGAAEMMPHSPLRAELPLLRPTTSEQQPRNTARLNRHHYQQQQQQQQSSIREGQGSSSVLSSSVNEPINNNDNNQNDDKDAARLESTMPFPTPRRRDSNDGKMSQSRNTHSASSRCSPPQSPTSPFSDSSADPKVVREVAMEQELLGWESIRQAAAALDNASLKQTSEEDLVKQCPDLKALQTRMRSLASELRSLEACYPTQTALVNVVTDAVDELTDAVVTRDAEQLAIKKRARSAEHASLMTAPMLEELRQLCIQRDAAVKRIAAVRVWREQLGKAMLQHRTKFDARLAQQREQMEKELKEEETTMTLLRSLFEQNSVLITQIARGGSVQGLLDASLSQVKQVSEKKDQLAEQVEHMFVETEETRRSLIRNEQRYIDEARVIRAKQTTALRRLETQEKAVAELTVERNALKKQLEKIRLDIQDISREYSTREADAFIGWTPRPSYIEPVAARQERLARRKQAEKAGPLFASPLKRQQSGAAGGGGGGSGGGFGLAADGTTTTHTANAVPPVFLSRHNNNNNNKLGSGVFSRSVAGSGALFGSGGGGGGCGASLGDALLGSSTASPFGSGVLGTANWLDPTAEPFTNVGIDVRGMGTTELVDALSKQIAASTREVKRTGEEIRKMDRVRLAIHEPVLDVARSAASGFDASVSSKDYLMRYMGNIVPPFLREPKPITNDHWDFATTEQNCFDFLISLASMAKRAKADVDVVSGGSGSMSIAEASGMRLQYENCIVRTLARCALLSSADAMQQVATGGGGAGSNNNSSSAGGGGGGGPTTTSPVGGSPQIPAGTSPTGVSGAASFQLSGGRRHAYHMLHAGNAYRQHSPIIRAALAAFSYSLPLDFIDAPLALLRVCVDKFLASDSSGAGSVFSATSANVLLAGMGAGASAANVTTSASMPTFGAGPPGGAAATKALNALMQIFSNEFSSRLHFSPVEMIQLQHAIQLDDGIQHLIEEVSKLSVTASRRLVFDFQAGLGMRPLRGERDAPSPALLLRFVIDLFLRRHELVASNLEQVACSVARPLGETVQMVIAESELAKAASQLRVDASQSLRLQSSSSCVLHPNLVKGVEAILGLGKKVIKVRSSVIPDMLQELPAVTTGVVPLGAAGGAAALSSANVLAGAGVGATVKSEQQSGGGGGVSSVSSSKQKGEGLSYDLNDFITALWIKGAAMESV